MFHPNDAFGHKGGGISRTASGRKHCRAPGTKKHTLKIGNESTESFTFTRVGNASHLLRYTPTSTSHMRSTRWKQGTRNSLLSLELCHVHGSSTRRLDPPRGWIGSHVGSNPARFRFETDSSPFQTQAGRVIIVGADTRDERGACAHHVHAKAQSAVPIGLDGNVGDRTGTNQSPMSNRRTLREMRHETKAAELLHHHRIPTSHHVQTRPVPLGRRRNQPTHGRTTIDETRLAILPSRRRGGCDGHAGLPRGLCIGSSGYWIRGVSQTKRQRHLSESRKGEIPR